MYLPKSLTVTEAHLHMFVKQLEEFAVEIRIEYPIFCLLEKEIGNGIRKQTKEPLCEARVFVLEFRVHVSEGS